MLGRLTYLVKSRLMAIVFAARQRVNCIAGAWVAPSYFEIVIGIPTFSIRPMVVWNKMLSIRKVVRSHTVSLTE